MSRHTDRVAAAVAHEAASFIRDAAGPGSLITVTRAFASAKGERITVFVSVFPAEKMRAALAFLERQRDAFSRHLKESVRLGPLPRVDFMPEDGAADHPTDTKK